MSAGIPHPTSSPPTHSHAPPPPPQATPDLSIASPLLCRSLWENYLDQGDTPAPDARKAWIAGARALAA